LRIYCREYRIKTQSTNIPLLFRSWRRSGSGHEEVDTKNIQRVQDKKALVLRLKRVEGQLRGLQRLIEEDAPCESVAQQLSAARRALDKTFHSLVGCLIESQLAGKGDARARIKHAVEILSRYS